MAYIKGVLSVYDLGCRWMFTCGQQAYADYAQISNNNVERRRIQDAAVRYGRSCRRIRDKFEVATFPCIVPADADILPLREGGHRISAIYKYIYTHMCVLSNGGKPRDCKTAANIFES